MNMIKFYEAFYRLFPDGIDIYFVTYILERTTSQFYILKSTSTGKIRRMKKNGKRPFAHPTKEQALRVLIYRQNKRIYHCNESIKQAIDIISKSDALLKYMEEKVSSE